VRAVAGLVWELIGGLTGDGHTLIIRRFWVAFVTKVRWACHAWGI
jgi:hypothetical protein